LEELSGKRDMALAGSNHPQLDAVMSMQQNYVYPDMPVTSDLDTTQLSQDVHVDYSNHMII
jgi:hypothetical protein